MTNLVKKLDSNITGLRFAEESTIGILPAAAKQVWYPLEPNSYTDFGANTKTVARQPINPSRQLRKGVLTDLDPMAGFANDLTQDGLTRLLQGFFFANLRESYDSTPFNGVQGSVASVTGSSHTVTFGLTSSLASVLANSLVKLSNFTKNANNGLFEVASHTQVAGTGVLTSSANYTNGDTITINGRVYTLRSGAVTLDGDVHVGASEAATITNIVNAINDSGGVPGTDYFVTAPDPTVTAVSGTHTVSVTSINFGSTVDTYATTTTSAATWGSATLTGSSATLVMTAGLTDESPAGTGARVEVAGYQTATGDVTITNDGVDLPFMTATVLDFTTLPLIAGEWIWIGGDGAAFEFATAADNGWARIRSITTHVLTFDKTSSEMVTDNGSGKTIQFFWGKMLRNEATPNIQVRRTYTMERTLGDPDLSAPTTPQAEYVVGAVSNEMTVNMTTAEKVTLDLTFLGTDYMTIDTTGTILSAAVGASAPAIVSEDAFNTTSHTVRAKMSVLSNTDSAPTSLFAEITEFKFTVKNNLKANKAVGKLGPFEITAGFFEGSGSVQAYFNQVAAVQAVRNNADVSIDFALAKNNEGILYDLRLLTLQSKGLDVKINEPILLPIEMKMGADRNFNDTVFMEFFDYLPNAAMPT